MPFKQAAFGGILQSIGALTVIFACTWLSFNHYANLPLGLLLVGLVGIGIGWTLR